jgi:hypothetical protein
LALGRYWCSHFVSDPGHGQLRGWEKKRGFETRKSEVGGGGIICAGWFPPTPHSARAVLISTCSDLLFHPIHDSRRILNKAVRDLYLQVYTL